jgi:hypothetical protein
MVSSKNTVSKYYSEKESNMIHKTPAGGKLRIFIYGVSLNENF